MRKIILASNNKNKIIEVKEILKNMDVEIVSMKEAGIDIDIEENGTTFEENALIKARAISKLTGLITIADDSGLEVDYLNKEPGVYSARYMGHDTSYDIKNKAIIDRLEGVEGSDRSARFVAAIAAVFPDGSEYTTIGTMEGEIAYEPAGENGFGYDPILYLPEYKKSSAEISPEEKNAISHRGKALRAMKKILEQSFSYNHRIALDDSSDTASEEPVIKERIMIVSDTHRRLMNLAEALHDEGKIDRLIHLGDVDGDEEVVAQMCDCELLMVPGNNDFFSTLPKELEVEICGKRILITHGHYYYVSLDYKTIEQEARGRNIDIVMFGHTHRPVIEHENDVYLVNPGSISYPRQQDGRYTYIMLEIDTNGRFYLTLKAVK